MRILRCVTLSSTVLLCATATSYAAGDCPQVRDTEYAPAAIAAIHNPLPASSSNIDEGEELYEGDVEPVACIACHGEDGDGAGVMASMFSPPPRDFTCASTMHQLSDGQLYWIIKNGSIGTSMPAFTKLEDDAIWKLIHYLRHFAPVSGDVSYVSELEQQDP